MKKFFLTMLMFPAMADRPLQDPTNDTQRLAMSRVFSALAAASGKNNAQHTKAYDDILDHQHQQLTSIKKKLDDVTNFDLAHPNVQDFNKLEQDISRLNTALQRTNNLPRTTETSEIQKILEAVSDIEDLKTISLKEKTPAQMLSTVTDNIGEALIKKQKTYADTAGSFKEALKTRQTLLQDVDSTFGKSLKDLVQDPDIGIQMAVKEAPTGWWAKLRNFLVGGPSHKQRQIFEQAVADNKKKLRELTQAVKNNI